MADKSDRHTLNCPIYTNYFDIASSFAGKDPLFARSNQDESNDD
jgi:hypothetical protein